MTVSSVENTKPIADLSLRVEEDAVACRRQARVIARVLGFDRLAEIRVAIAASELALLALKSGRPTHLEFSANLPTAPAPQSLLIKLDRIPPDFSEVAFERLVNRIERRPGDGGDGILLLSITLPGFRLDAENLERKVAALAEPQPVSLSDELTGYNHELLDVLDDAASHRLELQNINEELTETNRGVVALYDELDTLHRVGRVVASQIDLDSLLQAITEATTEVSGAEIGAFLIKEPKQDRFTCHTCRGSLCSLLQGGEVFNLTDLFQTAAPGEVLRIDDLDVHGPRRWASQPIRSYLAVTVHGTEDELAGVLVFGHREPSAFTERTERILASVAVQVSIGMQNARLYRNVQAASAAKDQFLAMLSHELRTPLNPVFMLLASLEGQADLPEEVRRDLQVMRRNLQLEARLIDDMLDLTRIVRGKIALHFETLDVHSLIPAVRDVCQEQIADQGVDTKVHLVASSSYVVADSARLQQVLWNLLSNAVKFAPKGLVEITTSNPTPEFIRIEIRDNGRGIRPETLAAIFQPFDQGDAGTNATYGGLGLGLAISKKVIDAHAGRIYAESAGPGKGARFLVELRTVKTPESSLSTVPSVPADGAMQQPGVRILLVEDHVDTLQTLHRLLNRRGFVVQEAVTASAATDLAAKHEFDLVISDVGLPDRTGLDLMRELRDKHNLRGIALSGYGMEADVERSHAAGFVAHLTKPIDFAALEKAIAWAVSPSKQE